MNNSVSEEEIATAVNILKKLSPGLLPFEIFHQVARLTVLPIVEVVPLRWHNGKTEVLLLKREDNDPIWPGALHTPGTVVRADDELGSLKSAFARVGEELGGVRTTEPNFLMYTFRTLGRGAEYSLIFWVECLEDTPGGTFYPVDDLPESIVKGHRDFIAPAAKAFEKSRLTAQI